MTSTSSLGLERADALRPRIHFTAESGWINDPHGLTFHDGRYHLFHQYVPGSTVWAPNCHWGHAVATDLLHWEHRPVALAPGDGDGGIWTGSLVVAEDGARILYTSTVEADYALGRVRVARPVDESWDEWVKGDVLVEPPADPDVVVFRDPFVLREGDGWRMFVGAGTAAGEALAITYTSSDLDSWQHDGVAARRSSAEREPVWTGALWECPQVVEVDGRHVLISSVWDDDVLHYAAYGIGDYADGRFEARDWGRLSFGDSYYAPSFFRDEDAGRA
ncbi:glycoside hydrolase family 32 protein [Rathayibacter sp. VKM Ac-2630]|uniref:glycoside hydrolase family 32 protein n=1 Tax=Rathayibacter sp. VKM Ac-2630 TaxID=1938617 RepID=UPI00191C18D8|nr:glycoside hydrolase family 32 protein [Rathayibacter sp. VKM Ac-2630]